MKLELHPDAVTNFTEKADRLLLQLSSPPKSPRPSSGSSFSPESYISGHFTDKDMIGEPRSAQVDGTGVEVSKSFTHKGMTLGLYEESYTTLLHLCQQMQGTRDLRDRVSVAWLADTIFDWVKERYRNTTKLPMVEYVLGKCREAIEQLEIWIPIAMLHVQSDITIGRITLKTITKEMLERQLREILKNNPGHEDKITRAFRKEQKELQGLAAATIQFEAERKRALELAVQETEISISLLRVFSPANLFPELNSYCTMLGKEHLPRNRHLVVQDGKIVESSSGMDLKPMEFLIINDEFLAMLRKDGLDVLSNLLVQERRTRFQEKVLDCLLLYSRSSLARNLADKLIYILVGLESILLKNENEPIQQNIGTESGTSMILCFSLEKLRGRW